MNKPFSILFVDDDPNIRRMVELFLKGRNVELQCAGNGRSALKYLDQKEYDLIFTDIQMPEMDGLTLLQEVRKKNSDVPVVVISAFGQESASRRAMELGASSALSKPFDRNGIIRVIEQYA